MNKASLTAIGIAAVAALPAALWATCWIKAPAQWSERTRPCTGFCAAYEACRNSEGCVSNWYGLDTCISTPVLIPCEVRFGGTPNAAGCCEGGAGTTPPTPLVPPVAVSVFNVTITGGPCLLGGGGGDD